MPMYRTRDMLAIMYTKKCSFMLQSIVIPTKCNDWRSRSLRAWRDLLFADSTGDAGKQQVPRLRRSSALRTIFFARDDRVVFMFKMCTPECVPSKTSILWTPANLHIDLKLVGALRRDLERHCCCTKPTREKECN